MTIYLIAAGLGLIWHGAQIVWIAPTPRQFKADVPKVEKGTPQAFQMFWLDQYAWIGIVLTVLGFAMLAAAFVWGDV